MEGIEKGRVEGRVEGIEQATLNMFKIEVPDEKTALYTGLAIEQRGVGR